VAKTGVYLRCELLLHLISGDYQVLTFTYVYLTTCTGVGSW